MHRPCTHVLLLLVAVFSSGLAFPTTSAAAVRTPRVPIKTDYHGEVVEDPYQWLEQANAPAVRHWTGAQNDAAREYLDRLPTRRDIAYQLEKLHAAGSAEYFSLQASPGLYFALRSKPPAQQPVLVSLQSLTNLATETVVVDPNLLDPRGGTSIDFYQASPDGRLVAVSMSENGSESGALHVFEVATGRKRGEVIPRVQFPTAGGSVAWNQDSTGFFYTRYPAPGERPEPDQRFFQQVYFHQLGTSPSNDRYELGRELPRIAEIALKRSDDGRHLVATVADGDGGEFWHYLRTPGGRWRLIAAPADKIKRVEFGRDPLYLEWPRDNALYLLSTKDAPMGRILRLPLSEEKLSAAAEVIKTGTNAIAGFVVSSSGLYIEDRIGGPSSLRFHNFYLDPNGQPESGEPEGGDGATSSNASNSASTNTNTNTEGQSNETTPTEPDPNASTSTTNPTPDSTGTSTNSASGGRRERAPRNEWRLAVSALYSLSEMVCPRGDELIFKTETHLTPYEWQVYNPAVSRSRVLGTALEGDQPADFRDIEVLREFASSKDGTRVPMTILRRRGTLLDGQTPTILTGYGGYGISVAPEFNFTQRVWFDQGGMVVVANLRGGGEFGEEWHRAGSLTRKQNVFDDFIACAEFLIRSNYTSPARLAIRGGSNGGLLMGAALTQRPDLFRAVVAQVGVYDMLRVELDPNGQFNTTEYGSVRHPEQFKALHAYSPFHRVQDRTAYPAVLLTTGEHDGRVNPAHSRKMTARLQAATASRRPILLRTSARSGHGMGTALNERVAEQVDVYSFLFDQLGVEYSEIARGPWVGGVTTNRATAKVRLARPGQTARLALSTSPNLSRARYFGPVQSETNQHEVVEFDLERLAPDTQYYYAIEIDGRLERGKQARFRTFPEAPKSFSFAFASCARTASTSDVFDAIRENNPLFYMNIGDFHYLDLTNSSIDKFRQAYDLVLSSPQQAKLYRSTAFFYMWDDHDYGGNNANKKSLSQEAVRRAYREYVPHYPLAAGEGAEPIYQSFNVGRTKFIVTDLRSERDSVTNKDDAAKSMMGARQKQWFKQELLAANGKFPVIFWISTVPWLGEVGTNYYRVTTNDWGFLHHTTLTNSPSNRTNRDAGRGGRGPGSGRGAGTRGGGGRGGAQTNAPAIGDQDHWSVFSTERREICDFIKSNHIQGVAILHGDSHMLAADDGSNGDFATGGGVRIPVMCGGPLDQNPSLKGGPYSQGVYRVRNREGGFGFVTVTDLGDEIEVKYSGRNNRNAEKVSLRFMVPVPPGSASPPAARRR